MTEINPCIIGLVTHPTLGVTLSEAAKAAKFHAMLGHQ